MRHTALLVLLLCAPAFAQQRRPAPPRPTPEVQKLLDRASDIKVAPKDRLAFFQQAFDLAQKREDRAGEASALNGIGVCYYSLGQPDKAIDFLSRSLVMKRALGDAEGEANTLSNLGGAYDAFGDRAKALECCQAALSIQRSIADRRGEAETLNSIGHLYDALGQGAKALEFFEQALPLLQASGDREGEAATVNNMGAVYRVQRQWSKALECFEQALQIERAVGDRGSEAIMLNNIGLTYYGQGDYVKALRYYEKSLPLRRAVKDPRGEATTINNIAAAFDLLGDKSKALEFYGQALLIHQAVGNREGEANTLNNIGRLYDGLGDLANALKYYEKALTLRQAVGDRRGEATTLHVIGTVRCGLGQIAMGLDRYRQALQIFREVDDKPAEAGTLGDIGSAFVALGETAKGLDYARQALALDRSNGDLMGEAASLSNIGYVYRVLGDKDKALDNYEKSLSILRAAGSPLSEAVVLNNIGRVYDQAGDGIKALDYFQQSLPLRRMAGDRKGEAVTLGNVANVYSRLGESKKALDYFLQALPILRATHDRMTESIDLSNMADCMPGSSVASAKWLDSLAVQACESLRRDAGALSPGQRRSFADSIKQAYSALAVWEARQGRSAEFQQVLALSKTDLSSKKMDSVPLTETESRWTKGWEDRLGKAADLDQRVAACQVLRSRTADQDAELKSLLAAREDANRELRRYLDSVAEEGSRLDPAKNRIEATDASRALDASLATLPKGTAAVYALWANDEVHLLVVRDGVRTFKTVPAKDLPSKITALRAALRDPGVDPRPSSGAVYDVLFRPIEGELSTHAPSLWCLVGGLRDVPIVALWDGKAFVAQRFATGAFNPAFAANLGAKPRSGSGALVYGATKGGMPKDPVTEEPVAFEPLPGVGAEAAAVCCTLGAKPVLDEGFSVRSLLDGLKRKPRVLHLASHFRYVPGDDRRSFLLMGDGGAWTVEGMKALPEGALKDLDLVALSACGTATGESATGDEVESFGAWMQRKGAGAVLSTLWPVADDGAAVFMPEFYRLWRPGTTRLQALREAQLRMIRGETTPLGAYGTRTAGAGARVKSDAPPWPAGLPRLAHPYYWAAFTLTGNPR